MLSVTLDSVDAKAAARKHPPRTKPMIAAALEFIRRRVLPNAEPSGGKNL